MVTFTEIARGGVRRESHPVRRLAFRPFKAARQFARDLLGHATRVLVRWSDRTGMYTFDWSQSDYFFWDKARRGRAKGLELSGLFLKPLCSKIAAWVLGDAPQWGVKDNPAGQDALNAWWGKNHPKIIRAYEEGLNLADCYLVINADLSTTIVPPHMVKPVVDPADYSKTIGWEITTRVAHPTEYAQVMTIVDRYTEKQRVRTTISPNGVSSSKTYRNLIGMVPVVHIPNLMGADELFGRPEGEPLVNILHRYGEVLDAGLWGNIRQGRPTPTIKKMGSEEQVEQFWRRYGVQRTVEHSDGTSEPVTELEFDADNVVTLGGDAEFYYAQPGSFAADSEKFLGLLFYLILQHTEVPEFAWGNAIASSKASAESQMPPFEKYIDKKRGHATQWLYQIAKIVLAYHGIFDVDVNAQADITLRWKPLTQQDGKLTLETIKWAVDIGIMDDETAAQLMPLTVENVSEMIAKARQQAADRRAAFDASVEGQINNLADHDEAEDEPNDDEPDQSGDDDEGAAEEQAAQAPAAQIPVAA